MDLNVSAATNVPQEVLLEILSAFRDRRSVLKTCSLVNKDWLHASRVILFYSINLTPLLAKNDWLSVFVSMPLGIGDHVRDIIVKNARWAAESSRTRVLLLSHFAASVTSLKLSNLTISDFADFTHVVSILKGLQALSIQRVGFEYSTLDLSEPIPPNRTFPSSLKSVYLYHVDFGLLFGWFLAHDVVPKLSKTYFGPLECSWKAKAHQFLSQSLEGISELGFLFAEASSSPYANYCGVVKDDSYPPPAPDPALQLLMDRYQTRYGIGLHKSGRGIGGNVRVVRIHKFFHGKSQGSATRSVWAARALVNVEEDFRGRVVLDVEVPSVREINGLEIDWEFLEEMFMAEIFANIEAIVFLVLTNVSISTLESFIALKMPRSYAKGILRFEQADEGTIRPLDTLS